MSFPFTLVDLTHTLSSDCPSWNGSCGFEHQIKLDYQQNPSETSFRVQQIKMHAGIGTHLDAPAHCIPNGKSIADLALTDLVAPCVKIDVSSDCDERFTLSTDDIKAFEQIHGKIPPKSFVIIYTGWDQYWDNPKRYRNDYQFPNVSKAAAQYFVEREVAGIGIDTLSPDRPSDGFHTHEVILGAGKYIVENIANATLLPPIGAFTLALPIKTQDGTEAPIRLIGALPS